MAMLMQGRIASSGACGPSRMERRAVVRSPAAGRSVAAVPPSIAARRHQRVVCMAASFSGGKEDPYTVLGVEPDADNNAINRAYTVKKFHARGNDRETARIEAAHSALMMNALSARLQGKSVDGSARYADREPLFPWRPKRWDATPNVMAIIGALQLALIAFTFQSPNMSKVIGSMLVGIAGNVLKQNAISPPPTDPEMATEEEEGRAGRNFVRGALLGLIATFAGVLIGGAPEYVHQAMGLPMLEALKSPGMIVTLKVTGSCLANWVMTAFFY